MSIIYKTLDMLRGLYPISGVLQIGFSGAHSLKIYEELDVTNAVFIDANNHRVESIATAFDEELDWRAYCHVIGEKDGFSDFYIANNVNESGFVSPDDLKPIWQNLKASERLQRRSLSLQSFFNEHEEHLSRADFNFLSIQCFPALSLLRGADQFLETLDIIEVRVLLDQTFDVELSDLYFSEINAYLIDKGFVHLCTEVETNKAIGTALFVRDFQACLEKLKSQNMFLIETDKRRQLEITEIKATLEGFKAKEQASQIKLSNIKEKSLKKLEGLIDRAEEKIKIIDDEINVFRECGVLDNKLDLDENFYNKKLKLLIDLKEYYSKIHEISPELNSWTSNNKLNKKRKVILIATMPRSGSTFLYNCIRSILFLSNNSFYSSWITNYNKENDQYWHVIKMHDPDPEFTVVADYIFSTRREILPVAASLRRMGWLGTIPSQMIGNLNNIVYLQQPFWNKFSNIEFNYNNLINSPREIIIQIKNILGINLNDANVDFIVDQLSNLKPGNVYSTVTELHPGHIGDGKSYKEILSKNECELIQLHFKDWNEKNRM